MPQLAHRGRKTSRRPGTVALERALSKLGLASRTQARELIVAGKVKVDGTLRTNPLYAVNPERSCFEIEGRAQQRAASTPRYILLHKPRGVVTTRSDERGRPTVFSLLGEQGVGLHAVGRLDLATTGLLILTNNTRFSSWVTDPANSVPRVYLVTVRGEVSEQSARAMEAGINEGGERLQASRVVVRKASGRESHLTVELRQGKNREIRRLFEAAGHEVTRLKRVSFGGLELGDLAPGEYRDLGREETLAAFAGASLR